MIRSSEEDLLFLVLKNSETSLTKFSDPTIRISKTRSLTELGAARMTIIWK